MALKKDLSIDFLGVHGENPFFLSSSPVSSDYKMLAKAVETGWGGVSYKTAGFFLPDECSPRFDSNGNPGSAWSGFKNMEMISDKPLEVNLKNIARLKRNTPKQGHHCAQNQAGATSASDYYQTAIRLKRIQ